MKNFLANKAVIKKS